MFQGLRQSSLFYILDKGGEKPTLRIGQVISVSNPQQKYPSYVPGQTPTLETTVDVKGQFRKAAIYGTDSELRQ